jgi:hypothetical protein
VKLFSRSFLVRARVSLYPPARAAVLLDAPEGRWPEHQAADRYGIGVGMSALACNRTNDRRWPAMQAALQDVASGIATSGSDPLPGDLIPLAGFELPGGPLRVVPHEGEGRTEVEAELVKAPGGVVPRIKVDPKSAAPTFELATLATLVALAADARAEERLALAFGIEGLLAWYREAQRGSPPRDAFRFANAHADDRLREIGRTLPEGL